MANTHEAITAATTMLPKESTFEHLLQFIIICAINLFYKKINYGFALYIYESIVKLTYASC